MANTGLSTECLPHLLVFPFPAQGHLLPLLELARLLISRFGFRLTVVVTPATLPLLRPFLTFAGPLAAPLVLPLPSHPSLPTGVEHVRDLPDRNLFAALTSSLSLLRHHILDWFRSHPDPNLLALISDFFLGWTHHLAADLGVPRIAFYSSGAFAVSVINQVFLRPPRPEAAASADALSFPSLPTSPSFPYAHLPSIFRRYAANSADPDWQLVREDFLANAHAWGAVFNTLDALEGPHLAHHKKASGHARVWAVGPLAAAAGDDLASEVADWLTAQPSRSVVYVCFGSQLTAAESVTEVVAQALDLSGARFIWAVGKTAVPEGFEDRTAERGLVVRGWAPQVAILGHGAVGSFVTHCGWNSVLEAASARVAMLAWPMEAEQFLNAKLLVEELGVAVRVGEGHHPAPDPGELSRTLAESVAEGAWPELRARAAELARSAAEAVGEGGSSLKQLEELAKELREVRAEKK